MSSVTGTEGLIHYVIVHDDLTLANVNSACMALAKQLMDAGVPMSEDKNVEVWTRSDGFMLCVPVAGADTRHFKFDGWSRVGKPVA